MDLFVVDTILHDSPDFEIYRTDVWAVWRPQVGRKKVWRFLTQQFNCCTCALCRCTVLLEHKFVTRHSAYRWQQYDVTMTSWSSIEEVSKRCNPNFMLVTKMKLPHVRFHCNNNCKFIQQFLWRSVCGCIFKVLQPQTISEVRNLIMRLWADNLCLQRWKNY